MSTTATPTDLASTSQPQHARPLRRRPALIVIGACLAALGVVGAATGLLLLIGHEARTDLDGFYTTRSHAAHTPTLAFASDRLQLGADDVPDTLLRPGWLGAMRVTATGTPGKPVFVGIARPRDIDRYLHDIEYDKVTDLELSPFSLSTERHPGNARVGNPAAQTFWKASAQGSGEQTIRWNIGHGTWSVVVMNADGTSDVETSISVGAKVPAVQWLAIALVFAGSGCLLVGVLLIVAGAVPRRLARP